MGSINYGTSDVIILGVVPFELDDYLKDPYFIEWAQEWAQDEALEALAYDQMERDYIFMSEIIQDIINDYYNLEFFKLSIDPGYYEGFTLKIDSDIPYYFDDYLERKDALKEITQLKRCLLRCADSGLVECFPGWCTGYHDKKETIKSIRNAIKQLREEVSNTLTEKQYLKSKKGIK